MAWIDTVPCPAVAVVTVSGSPSGSTSFAKTLTLVGAESSATVTASLCAVGAGLLTVHVNAVETVPPGLPSLAVTVTEYGPDCDALLSIVPLMTPVVGLIVRPAGRPVAV